MNKTKRLYLPAEVVNTVKAQAALAGVSMHEWVTLKLSKSAQEAEKDLKRRDFRLRF